MKIKNEMNIEISKIKKNKNYLEGFGKNNKYYPREKFKSSKNNYDFLIDENDKNYIAID